MRKLNYIYFNIYKKQILKQFVMILVSCFFSKESLAQKKPYQDFHPYFVVSNNPIFQKIGRQHSIALTEIITNENGGLKLVFNVYENTLTYFNQLLDSRKRIDNFFVIHNQTNDEAKKIYEIPKNVKFQKLTTYIRSRWILFSLLLSFLVVIIVSILAFRLRRININLEKLTKNRDKLFTIISHDLRSPLNSYQRYAEIVGYLIKTKQFDRLDEALKKIDEIGLNLAALLNNLLEWSLVKQMATATSVINVQDFFDGLLPIYRDMASLKDLSLVEAFEDEEIKIDPHLLSLITRNLLDNAIKYTPEGNEVIIFSHRKGRDFKLIISNREDSMSNAQKEKIRALFNNDYDYEFGEEGLGIGLILIKEFAQSNGVKITFYHSPDNLTTFEVLIPHVFFEG